MDASRPDTNGLQANVISFDLDASDVELYEAARALLPAWPRSQQSTPW